MSKEICIDKHLNIVRNDVSDFPLCLIVERHGKTYLRILNWIYEVSYYNSDKEQIYNVSLDDISISYLGIGNALIKWSVYDNDFNERKNNTYFVVLRMYTNENDVGLMLYTSHDVDNSVYELELDSLSLHLNMVTGLLSIIYSAAREAQHHDNDVHEVQGTKVDTKFLIFGSTNEPLMIV